MVLTHVVTCSFHAQQAISYGMCAEIISGFGDVG